MTMKIELVPATASLTIGDEYTKTNNIKFTINLNGNGPVWLTMTIPGGVDGVLRQPEDANNLKVETTPKDPKPKLQDGVWQLGDYGDGIQVEGSAELTVTISNILCRANEVTSQIIITCEAATTKTTATLSVEKAKPKEVPANPILYFIAEPTSCFGEQDVTLSWAVAGSETASLETPTGKQQNLTSPANIPLDQTFTFTLRAGGKSRQATVNVLEKGWHELRPLGPNAFPSVIFDSACRTDHSADKALYAIFARENGAGDRENVLCKSKSGITSWQVINSNVPDGMESSPGVLLGNRLWLIGGSAVDPDRIDNRICYYDLNDQEKGWRDATVTGFEEGARMGHACVIVDDTTIWMLGGLDKYHTCQNDVWRLSISKSGGDVKASLVSPNSDWKPRCMFSAVQFNNQIWVCGGVSSPNGNPLGDIWASSVNKVSWKERPTGNSGSVVVNAMGTGAAKLDSTLYTVITNQKEQELTAEMLTLGTNGVGNVADRWIERKNECPDFPSDPPRTPHNIAVVAFDGRLYHRRLYRDDLYEVTGERARLYVYVK